MKSEDMDPTTFILPENAVAQFWRKLVSLDACIHDRSVSLALFLFVLQMLVYFTYSRFFFFFFETEVNLDVNLPSFFFFFLNWGFHLRFLSPLSSLLSSLSSSQQPRALRLLQKVF